jgi:hypothetical protein
MAFTYLIQFRSDGRRGATYVKEEKSEDEIKELLEKGFVEVSDSDYQLLLGNTTGKIHIRNSDGTFSPYEAPLSALKARKLKALDAAFLKWRDKDAVLVSSLGFTIDADSQAVQDIAGLVALGEPAVFMDAENKTHELTAEQIQTLQKEVSASSSGIYSQKWALRDAINAAADKEALDAVEITFVPADFS